MIPNLCVDKREHTTVADLHWVEKIRGVDFAPLPFELRKGQTERAIKLAEQQMDEYKVTGHAERLKGGVAVHLVIREKDPP